jgi:hypothetical protein
VVAVANAYIRYTRGEEDLAWRLATLVQLTGLSVSVGLTAWLTILAHRQQLVRHCHTASRANSSVKLVCQAH